jgi:carboxypeptidase Taq
VSAYQTLHDRFARLGALGEAVGILHWDAATTMPAGGAAARGAPPSKSSCMKG